jgi:PAS domain S-box-containing protein
MENPPLYNSRIIKNYIEYINKFYPQLDLKRILEYAGIESYELEGNEHWLSQSQVDRFHEILSHQIDLPNLSKVVGRFAASAQVFGYMRKYALGFLTPAMGYLLFEKLANKNTLATTFSIKKLGRRKVEFKTILKEGIKESLFQCENRIGMMEALAKLYTKKFAHVEHPECVHKNGKICRYIISWDITNAYVWKMIRNYSFPFNFILNFGLYFFLPFSSWLWFLKFTVLLNMIILAISEHMEKKELIENITIESEATQSLLEETNRRYNEVLLVQEIGQTLSMVLDIRDSLNVIMEAMGKRLDFDRGMVLLADKDKNHLDFVTGYGYSQEDEEYFRNVKFHLNKPKSQGVAVESFKKQVPFLINDTSEVEKKVSAKSMEFLRRAGTRSFICVPILYEKESLGILLVDNLTSKRPLTKSDLNLLMGIAPQIAINIINAQSYKKIQESEERFRSLSQNSPDIIFTLNQEGSFSYVNPAWERLLGNPPQEVIGQKMVDLVKKDDAGRMKRLFAQVWQEKKIIEDTKVTMADKLGKEHIFSFSGAPNLDGDKEVLSLVGILRDITEQTLLEGQLRHAKKMEAIGTLAGGIAHDFNNLLMGIQGYASLVMLKMDETNPFYERLFGINQQVQSGVELTKQLLGFARGGKSEVRPADVNLIIQKSSEMFGRTKKEVRLHRELQDDLWSVEVDPGQIEQSILNLLVNAWQAMPGGGDITITTGNIEFTSYGTDQPSPGKYVRINIEDSGMGIEEHLLDRIFEPFFTTKEMGRGTGLGLAMVYSIIKNHGGNIFVKSQPGSGTVFTIFLPASEKKLVMEKKTIGETVRGKETILLVDDEEVIRTVTREILESLGYLVFSAANGHEAVAIFKEKSREIDLVLLDMIMPDMKGSQTYEHLKEINPTIKVLLCSGYSVDGQAEQLLAKGCNDFIQKPYTVMQLSQKVRSVLDLDQKA